MKNARPLNLATGIGGASLIGGGLATGDTVGIVMAIVGAVFALISGNVPPDPPPPSSARDMARRSGVLILFLFVAACAGPPPAPVHVSTTVEVDGEEIDATTRWHVCASERACAHVDVGLLWSEDGRAVCIELPQYDLLACHEVQ